MTDKLKLLKQMYSEQREMARHHENQRATIANLIIALSGGAIALITQQNISAISIPLSTFVIIIGLYGIYASMKSYERSKYHITRSTNYREELDELMPDAEILKLKSESDNIHRQKFKYFHKVRLNVIWNCLFVGIIALGLITLIIGILKII